MLEEPRIRTVDGIRKPDLVATKDHTTIVIDAQVVGEQTDLDAAHRSKINYYSNYKDEISQLTGTKEVLFSSVTVSWRGIWSPKSAKHLRGLFIISADDLKVISSRVLIGGLNNYHKFMALTSVCRWVPRHVRSGVG